ncbi:MAG: Gfo/Idh/MocA family protein [Verrucomicrobiia bacterium]|jgi:predicted dehydrogenase
MDKVRIGIIGMGNIGRFHAGYLLEGKVSRVELVAVCSTSPHKLEDYKAKGLKVFGDGHELIASGEIDAVIVATPHYQHTSLGIAAIEAGVHVMVEKPISAHKADAEKLIAAAQAKPEVKFGAMFQLRAEPRYAKIRQLLEGGELGDIVRMNWLVTDWFRSNAYYTSSAWRATWKGEGGGVLINQCLHQLDVLQWLLGMPSKVTGHCQLGRFHNIETEDNVSVYLEWPNGATGVFISSTGELPGTNRFEIAGTRGKVVLEDDKLTFYRNEVLADKWNETSKIGFAKPDMWTIDIPLTNADAPHAQFMQSFVDGILDNSPMSCQGEEGLGSIELANMMLYSSLIGQTVDHPLDSVAYEAKLQELIKNSTFEKEVVEVSTEDFTKSFNR